MARAFRFLRVVLPIVRLARVGLILLRLSDRLVRRMGKLLNRNIVLFEPLHAQKPESSDRHRLIALRSELEHARASDTGAAGPAASTAALRAMSGRSRKPDRELPDPTLLDDSAELTSRDIPVEAVVERLIQMTPERLIDQMGPASVKAIDRYMRLLDLPLVRRLPVVRRLVAYREKSPAEAVALAANYLGHLIQRALDVVYFFADLHGTLSPPVFLDRLGATIVNASRTPAKRLLWLGSVFLFLFLIVNWLPFLEPFRAVVDKVQTLMGWPVIILGAVCLVFWLLGAGSARSPTSRLIIASAWSRLSSPPTPRRSSRGGASRIRSFSARGSSIPSCCFGHPTTGLGRWPAPAMTRSPAATNRPGSRTASSRSCGMFACSIKTTSTARRCTAATPRRPCSFWETWL